MTMAMMCGCHVLQLAIIVLMSAIMKTACVVADVTARETGFLACCTGQHHYFITVLQCVLLLYL